VPQVVGDVRAKLELMLALLAQVRSSTMLLAMLLVALLSCTFFVYYHRALSAPHQ
jgi:hypothetical protein